MRHTIEMTESHVVLVFDEQTLIEQQHDHFNVDDDDAKKVININEEWFDHTFLLFDT